MCEGERLSMLTWGSTAAHCQKFKHGKGLMYLLKKMYKGRVRTIEVVAGARRSRGTGEGRRGRQKGVEVDLEEVYRSIEESGKSCLEAKEKSVLEQRSVRIRRK